MSEMRRTTADLIDELDACAVEKPYFIGLAIVVGFEDTTIFVFAQDENRLQLLNEAVEMGGTPVGLIGASEEPITQAGFVGPIGSRPPYYTRVFVQLADEEWAGYYLSVVATILACDANVQFVRSYLEQTKIPVPQENEILEELRNSFRLILDRYKAGGHPDVPRS